MALRSVFQHLTKACSSPLAGIAAQNNARCYSGRFYNHVELLGRVGREPVRVGEHDAVAFPFFTETIVRAKDGAVKVYPAWHRVVIPIKSLADVVFQSMERGQRCFLTGRITYKSPEKLDNGKMLHSNEAIILCDHIIFLEKSKKKVEEADNSSVTDMPKEAVA